MISENVSFCDVFFFSYWVDEGRITNNDLDINIAVLLVSKAFRVRVSALNSTRTRLKMGIQMDSNIVLISNTCLKKTFSIILSW